MKLVIGLGNPGEKYKNNRHNVGFMFVDWAKEEDFFSKEVFFTKTDCFMNESGRFVAKEIRQSSFVTSDVFIAHDDLDLKLGEFKINFGKGPELHNGIISIEEALGTKDFWRIRIGIDARDSGQARMTGESYVLEDFTKAEMEILNSLFPKIYEELGKRS